MRLRDGLLEQNQQQLRPQILSMDESSNSSKGKVFGPYGGARSSIRLPPGNVDIQDSDTEPINKKKKPQPRAKVAPMIESEQEG